MRKLLSVLPLLVLAAGCRDRRPRPPADSARPARPVVIDTSLPAVLGYAVNRDWRVFGWCLVTSRPDVRPGTPVRVVWPWASSQHLGVVGARRSDCAPADSTPGADAYDLRLPGITQYKGGTGIVLRQLTSGRIDSASFTFVTSLNDDRATDYLQTCNGARGMHLFVTSGSPAGPASWHHFIPNRFGQENEQPTCNGRFGEPLPDTVPLVMDQEDPPGVLVPAWGRDVDSTSAGATWVVLRRRDRGWELAETKVSYEPTEGACAEPNAGRRAVPSVGGEWLAVVSNVPELTPGRVVPAAVVDGGIRGLSGDSAGIDFLGRRAVIRSESQRRSGFRLLVDRGSGGGSAPTTIYSTDFADEGSWEVIWAGDLDRDDAVDLLLSATWKYSVESWRLYLSRQRRPGERWRPAAVYREAGC